jgi:DNA-binding transcriptional LysR family regulator
MIKTGLTELEAVLALAQRRGFRAAALDLGVSTSALSNAVAALEARVGVRLFHRTTRSVALTEAGSAFIAAITPAMGQIRTAMAAAGALRTTPAGSLRINASLGAARMLMAPLVLAYVARYPDVVVEIGTQGQLVDIVAEGFDAGIRLSELVPRDMVRVAIGAPLRMAVVAAPAYLAAHAAPALPSDLMDHRCIRGRFPSGKPSPWEFAARGEALSLDVPGPLILDDPGLMLEAARAGVGIAMLAEWHVADDLASGRLVRLLDAWTAPFPGLALFYPAGRHVPAPLRALIDLIREADVDKQNPAAHTQPTAKLGTIPS